MSECISPYFILNNKLLDKSEFNGQLVTEGKSIYTVIRIIKGVPLFLELHYERLINSSIKAGLQIWLTEEEINKNINQLLKSNDYEDGNIKIVFSFETDSKGNFLVYYIPHHYPDKSLYKNGISTITLNAERNNPNIKFVNKTLRETTNNLIRENKVYEIILIDNKGFITEGSRSNVFMIKDETIFTPPLRSVLPGITRSLIFDICNILKLKILEKEIHISKIKYFDGVFISGTSPKILPVNKIDDYEFTSESIVLRHIILEYDKLIDNYINSNNKLKKK